MVFLSYRAKDFLLLIQKFVTDRIGFHMIYSIFACRLRSLYPAFVHLSDPIFVRGDLVTLCEMKSWQNHWASFFYANQNTIVSLLKNFSAIFALDCF